MKMILRVSVLILALFAAMNSTAYIDVNGTRYAACHDCETDEDFRAFAEAHYNEFNGPPVTVVVDGDNSFWLNKGTIVPGIIKQVRRNITRTVDRSNPSEPVHTITISYDLEPVSQASLDLYNDYIAELNAQVNQGVPTILAKNLGALDITVNGAVWLNNTDFMSDYAAAIESQVSNAMATSAFNPFFFVDKPIIARFNTTDNYSVEVFQKDGQWFHLFTWATGSQALMDTQGNFIETSFYYDKTSVCSTKITISFCREAQGNSSLIHVIDTLEEQQEQNLENPDDKGARRCRVDNCGYP